MENSKEIIKALRNGPNKQINKFLESFTDQEILMIDRLAQEQMHGKNQVAKHATSSLQTSWNKIVDEPYLNLAIFCTILTDLKNEEENHYPEESVANYPLYRVSPFILFIYNSIEVGKIKSKSQNLRGGKALKDIFDNYKLNLYNSGDTSFIEAMKDTEFTNLIINYVLTIDQLECTVNPREALNYLYTTKTGQTYLPPSFLDLLRREDDLRQEEIKRQEEQAKLEEEKRYAEKMRQEAQERYEERIRQEERERQAEIARQTECIRQEERARQEEIARQIEKARQEERMHLELLVKQEAQRNEATHSQTPISIKYIFLQYKGIFEDYKKNHSTRINDALTERVSLLLHSIDREMAEACLIEYPKSYANEENSKNKSLDLKLAREKDIPKLQKLYASLPNLPEPKK